MKRVLYIGAQCQSAVFRVFAIRQKSATRHDNEPDKYAHMRVVCTQIDTPSPCDRMYTCCNEQLTEQLTERLTEQLTMQLTRQSTGLLIAEFEEAFHVFDTVRSGFITTKKLDVVTRSLSNHDTQEAELTMNTADAENHGTVGFSEFCTAMSLSMHTDDENDLHDAFSVFDKNGTGFVSAADVSPPSYGTTFRTRNVAYRFRNTFTTPPVTVI